MSRGGTRPRSAAVLRPTSAGLYARRVWPEAVEDVQSRWRSRFGDTAVDDLLDALRRALTRPPLDAMNPLPWAPPEVHPPDGFRTQAVDGPPDDPADRPLGILLGQVLTAWTLVLERA